MDYRIIWTSIDETYRLLEYADTDADLEDLKGDMYKPEFHPDLDAKQIRREELEFEELVNREGVFGYVLEKWNAKPGCGFEHVDSCWGFVGQYSENDEVFNHYIVQEMRSIAGDLK